MTTQNPKKFIRRSMRGRFIVIGLTGSIAMGKSTAGHLLKMLGVPVFDADAAVHHLMKPGGEICKLIEERFPGVTNRQGVDRQKLGNIVFSDPNALKDLEYIIHPRTRSLREMFLLKAAFQRRPIVALDIPLLFESNSEQMCDVSLVVSAPKFLQKQRAMARPGMNEKRFKGILERQMPDAEKRRRADHVVYSGLGKRETLRGLVKVLKVLKRSRRRHV